MKVFGSIGKIIEKFDMKDNKGMILTLSLGYNKGFMKLYWFFNLGTFKSQFEIQKGDTILIPSMDLSISTNEYNKKTYMNVIGKTTYIEKYNAPKGAKNTNDYEEIDNQFEDTFNDLKQNLNANNNNNDNVEKMSESEIDSLREKVSEVLGLSDNQIEKELEEIEEIDWESEFE